MNRNGILITAYKQLDLTRKCIDYINNFEKSKYYFVVISTSETSIGFKELPSYFDNVKVIEWLDAPKWNVYYDSDFNFKIIRILYSIKKGIKIFDDLKIERILHLHSDTFWKRNKEDILIQLFEDLKKYMIITDIDVCSESNSELPKNIHYHPEGMMFNIPECKKYGYGFDFEKIISPYSGFKPYNNTSIEALLGQFAVFCLTGQNVIKGSTLPKIYYDKVKINLYRDYHGEFESGLVNVRTNQ